MPDLTVEEGDRCPGCDNILYGTGPCRVCAKEPVSVPGAKCNFTCRKPAEYDFKTVFGYWAHGCHEHWLEFRVSTRIGVGTATKIKA